MTSNSGLFQTIGLNLFRGFAVITRMVWFGAKAALGSADGRRSFPLRSVRGPRTTDRLRLCHDQVLFHTDPRHRIESFSYQLVTNEGI